MAVGKSLVLNRVGSTIMQISQLVAGTPNDRDAERGNINNPDDEGVITSDSDSEKMQKKVRTGENGENRK